ncbi:hypothetical protein PPYC2_21890 [Paenibacillus polymyxa]|nr:hypothetical protein PPYC2_21890 [Paenibacillus polymyxa]
MLEELLVEADNNRIEVREHTFKSRRIKGLYMDGVITLNPLALTTLVEKACVLAEELGHHHTSFGNILDLKDMRELKQEKRARNWGYERLVPLNSIIQAYKSGARNRYEIAEHIGVTEDFFEDSVKHYEKKYGLYTIFDDHHIIFFNPNLQIIEFI